MSDDIVAYGSNFFGQLGIGDTIRKGQPYEAVSFGRCGDNYVNAKDIQDIQCGSEFTVTMGTKGQVNMLYLYYTTLLNKTFLFFFSLNS